MLLNYKFLWFALFAAYGLLQCYSCDSTKDKECHKIRKNTEVKLLVSQPWTPFNNPENMQFFMKTSI